MANKKSYSRVKGIVALIAVIAAIAVPSTAAACWDAESAYGSYDGVASWAE